MGHPAGLCKGNVMDTQEIKRGEEFYKSKPEQAPRLTPGA